jgi:predicted DNA-binding transcriptional regulator YafY
MRVPALRRSRTLRLPSRRPPLPRFNWILARLREGKPFLATDLARAFEVDVRTAYRDIRALQDQLNVPFDYEPSARTYRLTEPMALLSPCSPGACVRSTATRS